MKQMRLLSYLVFMSFSLVAIGYASAPIVIDYCNSGVDGCKCGKPKPPGYYSSKSAQTNIASDTIVSSSMQSYQAVDTIVSSNMQSSQTKTAADTTMSSNSQSYPELAWKEQFAGNVIAFAADASADMPERSPFAREARNDRWMNTPDNAGTANRYGTNRSDASYGTSTPVKGCKYGSTCELNNGIIVRVKNPQLCMLGEQIAVEYEVLATSDVYDVVLTAQLSDNASYVSSQPDTKVKGKELTWNFGEMKKDQRLSGKILLKTDKEGEICTCFNVSAASEACCSSMCAKASLACECTGPAEVLPGEQFSYAVIVTNTGSYPAKDVILAVTDNDKVAKPLNLNLGTIEPGKARKANIPVTATKRGKIAYTAVATSSTANQVQGDLSTLVTSYSLDCTKKGPKEALLGQKAPYQISVSNTGDRDLHDVVITETIHPATAIVSAEGAAISDKKAVWKIPVLKAGDKADYKIVLTTRTKGNFANSTLVTNKEAYNTARETNTNWKGYAALDMSMNTSESAIFVGETTRYKIHVTNQGHETDSNVTIAAIFPDGLVPVSASGDSEATINGQTVNFAPKNLNPRQTLEQFVVVKATKQGDLRPKVQVSSDTIKPAITQEESLIVN